jgi:hypothetical protein
MMANQTERVDHLDAALRYASQGVPVFPLAPRSKFPLISAANGGHGLLDATTDAAQIQAWWMAHPTANIGRRTGLSFDVVDLDGEAAVDVVEQARAGRETAPRPGCSDRPRRPLVREAHWADSELDRRIGQEEDRLFDLLARLAKYGELRPGKWCAGSSLMCVAS